MCLAKLYTKSKQTKPVRGGRESDRCQSSSNSYQRQCNRLLLGWSGMVRGVSMGMRRPPDLRSVNKKTVKTSYPWIKWLIQLKYTFV